MLSSPAPVVLDIRSEPRWGVVHGEPVGHAGLIARQPCRRWEAAHVEPIRSKALAFEVTLDEGAFASRGGAR